MAAIAGILQKIPLLGALEDAQIEKISAICERLMISPGEEVVVAGRQADAAYYLIDGHVDCVTGANEEAPIPPGSVLLEMAMIVEIDINATCIARGHAKLLKIPRKEMHALMQEDILLTDGMIEALTLRLQDMADTMREASVPFQDIRQSA